jgi:UDP-3-O-[3-hydroxymyristoyl] glucosamine N-acyltransferase LpxD
MKLKEVLEKYDIPLDAKGTCPMQYLEEKHVSYIGDQKYIQNIVANANAYILVKASLLDEARKITGNFYIEAANVVAAFLEIHNAFHRDVKSLTSGDFAPKEGDDCEIHSSVKFGQNVKLGENVKIQPSVVVGSDVQIGDNTEIYSNTVIYDRVSLGKRNIIDGNASIGGDGYRIMKDDIGQLHRLIHIGGVLFGDDVEFGNSSCVDRGTFGNTILDDRVKVDNIVHIGHNVRVNKDSQLAASSCIGGSTIIGRNCWIGIGATLSNGLVIGDNASVLINAVVTRDVPDNETVSGFYAVPNDVWRLVVKDRVKRFGSPVQKQNAKEK